MGAIAEVAGRVEIRMR